jgi:methyltransferase (TIGR00027 family)
MRTTTPLDADHGNGPLVRDISDTAFWVAYHRAVETERPDAHFRDPYARALAGERGRRIATARGFGSRNGWAFTARTVLFDRIVDDAVRSSVDLVVNLAAGLDTRPYRMDLPAALRWIEIDLPGILDYKEGILGGATPRCQLERVRLDLSDEPARRALFSRLALGSSNALIVTEGLIIYLSREQVVSLARDLAAPPPFRRWAIDLSSPGLLKMMARQAGKAIVDAGAPFRFAPVEGPEFFLPLRWTPVRVDALLDAARTQNRLSWFMRLLAALPQGKTVNPNRPWSAVLELRRE